MQIGDARVIDIPKITKREAADQELRQMQAIFQGDDLSGLDIDNRRQRKVSANDIDEWLKQLQFSPDSDGDEETPVEAGAFKKGYRMRLKSDVLDDEKQDTIAERTTNYSTNKMNPILERANSRKFGDYSLSMHPIENIDSTSILKQLQSELQREDSTPWITVYQDSQFYSDEVLDGAKIFTRKNSIILVKANEELSPKSDRAKSLQRSRSLERPVLPFKFLQPAVSHPSRIEFLSTATVQSFGLGESVDPRQPNKNSLYSWIFIDKSSLLTLEWREDPELDENLDLAQIHWISGEVEPPSKDFLHTIKTRLETITKQEGVHPPTRFIQKLLEGNFHPQSQECSPANHSQDNLLSVKKMCEEAHMEMDADLQPSRRKPSYSGGRHRSRFRDFDYEEEEEGSRNKKHSREPSPEKSQDEASYSM